MIITISTRIGKHNRSTYRKEKNSFRRNQEGATEKVT